MTLVKGGKKLCHVNLEIVYVKFRNHSLKAKAEWLDSFNESEVNQIYFAHSGLGNCVALEGVEECKGYHTYKELAVWVAFSVFLCHIRFKFKIQRVSSYDTLW